MHKVDTRAFFAPMSRAYLEAVANRLGLPASRDIVPILVRTFSDAVVVPMIVDQLPAESQALLFDCVLSDLVGLACPDKSVLDDAAFAALNDNGLMGVGRDHLGALRVVMPRDAARMLAARCRDAASAMIKPAPEAPLERVAAQADVFLRNATTLIALAETEGIVLTAKLDITKNDLTRKILPCLELGAYGQDPENRYPLDLLHTLTFLRHFGLLEVDGQRLIPGAGADAFLEADDAELVDAAAIYAGLAGEPAWPAWLLASLQTLPDAAWTSVDVLCNALAPARVSRKSLKELRERREEMLLRMEILGAVETGWTAGNERFVRMSRAIGGDVGAMTAAIPEASGTPAPLYVTADFKIAAARHLPASVRRQISRFARLQKSDQMDQWEITRESVTRAADTGLDFAVIIAYLKERAAAPVPTNVADSIRIWQEHHRDIRYHHGPTLIVTGSADQKWVRDLADKSQALIAEPMPGLFVLHPDHAQDVLDRLRERRAVGIIPIPHDRKKHGKFSDVVADHIPKTSDHDGGAVQMMMP